MSQQQKVYLLCLNPNCATPNDRCLRGSTIHSHPPQCIHHLFPTETIIEKDWHYIEQYPSDNIGRAIKKKLAVANHQSYLSILIKSLRIQLVKMTQELQHKLLSVYPCSQLFDEYQDIYQLDKIAYMLKNQVASHHQLTKLINAKFLPTRYNTLIILNQRYDNVQAKANQLITQFQHQITKISNIHSKEERSQIPDEPIKVIKYGLTKSKYIGSSKIQCMEGQVCFPRIPNLTSFLPWVYTQKYFEQGTHEFKITSGRFPFSPNAGFLVLEENDIDLYPYLRYKSIFSKEGKNFDLVEGDAIQQFVSQTAIVKLKLQLDGTHPKAIIFDSERRCKYVCDLEKGKKYRMGLYGAGWSVVVIQLT